MSSMKCIPILAIRETISHIYLKSVKKINDTQSIISKKYFF